MLGKGRGAYIEQPADYREDDDRGDGDDDTVAANDISWC